MERLYRLVFLALFILGFIGAAASGNDQDAPASPSVVSLMKDVQLAEEVNALNEGRWNQDVSNLHEDSLAKVENLLETDLPIRSGSDDDNIIQIPSEPPASPDALDPIARAKSELSE